MQYRFILILYLTNATLSTASQVHYSLSPRQDAPTSYVGYVDDPAGRGTASLVLSCVLTLVLCVWSALHLNVPSQSRRRRLVETLWLNFRWIVAGIYAPELVVFVAWRQWSSARLLQHSIQDLRNDESNKISGINTPWTMSHSFFACAGGFAVELESSNSFVPNRRGPADENQPPRITLTAKGVLMLARYGGLPCTTRDEIEDKSKANDLAKATVIVQATWMLIQVIGRLAARLPVTLLEVNTVAHVLCAFAMYIFWWNKPLLPHEPIVIRDESLAPLIALMYTSSEMSGFIEPEFIKSQTIIKTLLAKLLQYSTTPEADSICIRDSHGVNTPMIPSSRFKLPDTRKRLPLLPDYNACYVQQDKGNQLCQSNFFVQYSGQSCLAYLTPDKEKEKETAFFERRPRIMPAQNSEHCISKMQIQRWTLLKQALASHPKLLRSQTLLSHAITSSNDQCIHLKSEQLVVSHVPNWPSTDLLRSVDGLIVGMVLWLANLCYGGIHAAAWGDHFPTTAEKWLWRASSLYIAFCGGLWVILNLLVSQYPKLNSFWEKWADGKKSLAASISLGCLVLVCGFSLFAARVFIVVEAFISIRQLPEATYQTPQWTSLFPHF